MQIHELFLTLFLIIIVARLFGELFTRLGIPSVLGELLAGVVLGPSMLGFVEPGRVLALLAEIGILLLLFDVGLDTDFKRLRQAGLKAISVAFFGAVIPFLGAYLLSFYVFNLSTFASLFIGGTLTATSIGITLRVLKDIHRDQTNIAQIVLGAAVLDDIIGVIALAFVYDFAITKDFSYMHTAYISFQILLFITVAPVIANFLGLLVRKFCPKSNYSGLVSSSIIAIILLFSYVAHSMGAPVILGAFAVGIALSQAFVLPNGYGLQNDVDFFAKIKQGTVPVAELFTPIFFVMVGVSIDFSDIAYGSAIFWYEVIGFTLIAVFGKYFGAFMITQKCSNNKMLIGISMIPRGEVGLIFAKIGQVNGVLDNETYSVLIFVIIITTVIPALLLRHLFRYECA